VKLKNVTLTAIMAGLCVIGSFIKIPSPLGSTALDSAPAFLAATILPPAYAGVVGFFGHLATALSSGMPFGPLHFIVAIEMLLIVSGFAMLHRKQRHIAKWAFLLVMNGIIAPVPFYFFISPAFYLGALPSLIVATSINVIVTILVIPFVLKATTRLGGHSNA